VVIKSTPTRVDLRERLLRPDPISGSEMLLRSLFLEGVECIFGYPGGSVLFIYDAIYDFAGLKHLLARHEQGAIHAADGYARASGKTGVCVATSGPGATNLITGIAMAYKDNIPLVVITGNVPLSSRGTDAFQEADVIGMTLPITKHSYYITDAEQIPTTVRAAFEIASTGRRGPVLIDIPKDVSSHRKVFRYQEQSALTRYYRPEVHDEPQMQREVESEAFPGQLSGEDICCSGMLTTRGALSLISESAPSDVIVTVDERRYQAMIIDCFRSVTQRSLIAPSGMEVPGFSLPAAIGAQMAFPGRTIFSINGEGGIQKCAQEMAVCAIHNIPLKIVVFSSRESSEKKSPDFVKLAEAYGLKGFKAERFEEAREIWTEAMKWSGPVLVEFKIEGGTENEK
jgi:thiamine pyrophosphate-dependent acetolactate synthase large subunit-like protein